MRLVELLVSPEQGTAYIDIDRVEALIPVGPHHTRVVMRSGFEVVVEDDADHLAERIEPYDAERHD